jgi:hypothetical protein
VFVQDVIGKLNYVSAKSRHRIKHIVVLGTSLNNIFYFTYGILRICLLKNTMGNAKTLGSGTACMDNDIDCIINRIIIINTIENGFNFPWQSLNL